MPRKSGPRNHPVSRFLAAGVILLGIGFASYDSQERICKGESAKGQSAKGQDTGSDGSSIDQIALAPNSGLSELGMSAVEVGYPTSMEATPSASVLPSYSWAFSWVSPFSKGLTQ
jgi:hypothetical protein